MLPFFNKINQRGEYHDSQSHKAHEQNELAYTCLEGVHKYPQARYVSDKPEDPKNTENLKKGHQCNSSRVEDKRRICCKRNHFYIICEDSENIDHSYSGSDKF